MKQTKLTLNYRPWHALGVLVCLAIAFGPAYGDSDAGGGVSAVRTVTNSGVSTCGQRSLLACLQILGIPATIDEVAKASPCLSFRDLISAAETFGVRATAWELDWSGLRATVPPLIVHVGNNHFLVVERVEEDGVELVDLPNYPQDMERNQFQKIWDGNALLLAREERDAPVSPYIRFETLVVVTEGSPGDAAATVTFPLKNCGTGTAKIMKVEGGCSCQRILYPVKPVLPGEKGNIQVVVDTSGKDGWNDGQVKVDLLDPKPRTIDLSYVLNIPRQFHVVPDRFDLGSLTIGEKVVRYLMVYFSEAPDCPTLRLTDDQELLLSYEPLLLGKASGTRTRSDANQEDPIPVRLTFEGKAPSGRRVGTITVVGTNGTQVSIPYVAQVREDVFAIPSLVYFGRHPNDCTISVASRLGNRVRIRSIRVPEGVTWYEADKDTRMATVLFRKTGNRFDYQRGNGPQRIVIDLLSPPDTTLILPLVWEPSETGN